MVPGAGPASRPQGSAKPKRTKPFQADIGAIGVEVVVTLQINEGTSAQSDVCLYLLPCPVHVLRHASHFKHWVLLTTRSHNVRVSLLLDAFDGGSFRSHHQPHHTIRDPDLDGSLARQVGWTGQ